MTSGHPNQLQPGKRPRVTLSPTLVTHDGKFEMILSTPGGDNQDQALLQVLLNIIEFGMTPQEAVEAPALPNRALLQLVRQSRIHAWQAESGRPHSDRDRRRFAALWATVSRSPATGAIHRRPPSSGSMTAC